MAFVFVVTREVHRLPVKLSLAPGLNDILHL